MSPPSLGSRGHCRRSGWVHPLHRSWRSRESLPYLARLGITRHAHQSRPVRWVPRRLPRLRPRELPLVRLCMPGLTRELWQPPVLQVWEKQLWQKCTTLSSPVLAGTAPKRTVLDESEEEEGPPQVAGACGSRAEAGLAGAEVFAHAILRFVPPEGQSTGLASTTPAFRPPGATLQPGER